jgi:hypothetical protein
MEKTIGLALNKFDPIPNSLRTVPAQNTPRSNVIVNLAGLYHHYYLSSYGRLPPNPDPAHFEFAQQLLADRELRLRGRGIGAFTESRRNRSNDMGHAFCRWFLHDHANITYFAHMEDVLGYDIHRAFGGITIERSATGDTPDLFCAEGSNKVFLAEAKGSHKKLSFKSSAFDKWRKQFTRVTVRDAAGIERKIKGFIVATQFASEAIPTMNSVLLAEDPESPGEDPLATDAAGNIGRMVISRHYARVAEKLNQPVLAAALAGGYVLPEEYLIQVTVWAFRTGPLEGRRFVGGYYPGPDGVIPLFVDENGAVRLRAADPFRLDVSRGTFVGVEEKIFSQVAAIARGGTGLAAQVSRFEEMEHFYSAIRQRHAVFFPGFRPATSAGIGALA